MDYTEKTASGEKALERLEKLKDEEKKTKFYSKQISHTTVVYCKREDRLEDYNKTYNKKITIDR